MTKWGQYILSLLIGSVLISGCSSTPDEVLPQEKMAQLLADIHIGESIVDVERTKFYSDSLKKTVKQSILVKHGVTQAQLDTSFVWYGHNIEEYIAVYDRVIEILDDDINKLNSSKDEKVNIAMNGDSVDTWQDSRYYCFNINSPSQYITFNYSKDQYWEQGDCYVWRLKLLNNSSYLKWGLAADYSDGSSEFINTTISNEGWNEIKFISDSTKSLNKVYGYIYIPVKENEIIYLDSLSLVRSRVDKKTYPQRISQRSFEYGKSKKESDETEQSENSSNEENIGSIDTPDQSFNRRNNRALTITQSSSNPNDN